MTPRCVDCGKAPDEITEYVEAAKEAGITSDRYVREEEGTYNPENGLFLCTDDFLKRAFAQGVRLVGEGGRPWKVP